MNKGLLYVYSRVRIPGFVPNKLSSSFHGGLQTNKAVWFHGPRNFSTNNSPRRSNVSRRERLTFVLLNTVMIACTITLGTFMYLYTNGLLEDMDLVREAKEKWRKDRGIVETGTNKSNEKKP
eukprot:TRINITY_DN1406_c0_g1_i1.p1 TRINITY_DN1406_c0_g1~~TRINITY_DN1406_c0_g1_i1.p1  ORF type:complete len:122 (-),score=19.55 TRINITY_DN1406_c0_g1_i1:86-451(-)